MVKDDLTLAVYMGIVLFLFVSLWSIHTFVTCLISLLVYVAMYPPYIHKHKI